MAFLRFRMEIGKLFICSVCWLNSGSEIYLFIPDQKLWPSPRWFLVRGISDGCGGWTMFYFYSYLLFALPFFTESSLTLTFSLQESSAFVFHRSSNLPLSFLPLTYFVVGALVCIDHYLTCVFFLCPLYSCAPHRIWSQQLFWISLGFTPTRVITSHCSHTHVTVQLLFLVLGIGWLVINKGNRWSLFLVETMGVAVHLGEGGLVLAFGLQKHEKWIECSWFSCRLVFKATDLQNTLFTLFLTCLCYGILSCF